MPNIVDTLLTVVLPRHQVASWCAAVEGPTRWTLPNDDDRRWPPTGPRMPTGQDDVRMQSAHQRMAYEDAARAGLADEQAWIRQAAWEAGHDWPDWMPIGVHDRLWLRNGHMFPHMPRVPFSIPRLLPVTQALFEAHQSMSLDEEGFQRIDDGLLHQRIRAAILGLAAGTRWTPATVEQGISPHPTDPDKEAITARWRTGNAPVDGTRLAQALVPLCAAHDAVAAMAWMEEDRLSGISAFDAMGDHHTSYPRGSFTDTTTLEENGFWDWDTDAAADAMKGFLCEALGTDLFDPLDVLPF